MEITIVGDTHCDDDRVVSDRRPAARRLQPGKDRGDAGAEETRFSVGAIVMSGCRSDWSCLAVAVYDLEA